MNGEHRPPDVVVVMTDQQRADACRREGFTLDTTPFLDSLAAEGAWFDRAYTTSPLCAPARTSLLTGRWPSVHGVRENAAVAEARHAGDLFSTLRGHGYATAIVGKNHSYATAADVDGYDPFMHGGRVGPNPTAPEQAFDDWLTGLAHRTPPEPAPFPVELQNPYRIVSEAIDTVERFGAEHGDRPYVMWLSFPEPHNPYQVPEPYFSLFPTETLPPVATGPESLADRPYAWRYLRELFLRADPAYESTIARARASYLGMLRLIDDQVRRFVTYLRESGRWADTVLFATSDHGDFVGEYGLLRKGPELPEVLTRIPLLATGRGVAARPEPVPACASLADLLPTICAATGAEPPPGVQGRDLWPVLGGGAPGPEFRSVYAEQGVGGRPYEPGDVTAPYPGLGPSGAGYDVDELNAVTQSGRRRMVRLGDWKLVLDAEGEGRLYDLAADPYELTDRWADPACAQRRGELLHELATWSVRVTDPLPVVERGYPRL